jgi:hypothetical protein
MLGSVDMMWSCDFGGARRWRILGSTTEVSTTRLFVEFPHSNAVIVKSAAPKMRKIELYKSASRRRTVGRGSRARRLLMRSTLAGFIVVSFGEVCRQTFD